MRATEQEDQVQRDFVPKDFKMSRVKNLTLLHLTQTTERYDNLAKLLTKLILGKAILFPEHHVFTGIVRKLVKDLERNTM